MNTFDDHHDTDHRIDQVVALALSERVGVFQDFVRPMLLTFARRLARGLDAPHRAAVVDAAAVLEAAVLDLVDQLTHLSLRTLITAFHAHREAMGMPLSADSTYAFDEFQEHLRSGTARDLLFDEYPVLADLLERTIERRVHMLLEVVDHFAADAPLLLARGLIAEPHLTDIRVSEAGDSHNGGRTVTFVRTRHEEIVHKPRPMDTELLAERLLGIVNPHLEASTPLRLPLTVAVDGHGWQERISHAPATSIAGCRRYAYRLGAFTTLFSAIGATDLHCENLIAAGEHPMFIDLETIVHLRYSTPGAAAMSRAPVLTTGLVPYHQPGASIDVDISAFGSVREQESRLTWTLLKDAGSDATRLETAQVVMSHSANLLRLGDDAVDLGELSDDFEAGLEDARRGIVAELDRIKEVARGRFVIRQVTRPTAVYTRFVDAATHPRYLADPAERRRLFHLMKPLQHVDEAGRGAVQELEVAAMMTGDVPYFSVASDSTTLVAPEVGAVAGVLACSPSEEIIAALDHFLAMPAAQHRYLALMGLRGGEAQLDDTDDRPTRGDLLVDLWSEGPEGFPGRVSATLRDLDIGLPGRPGWVLPSLTPAGQISLMPASGHLYDGGGMLLALAGDPDPAHRALAGDAVRSGFLDTVAPAGTPLGASVFSGLPSAAYVAWELSARGVADLRDWAHDRLRQVLAEAPPDDAARDMIGGLAGTGAWIAGSDELSAGHGGLLERACREILDALRGDDPIEHEFAHGRLGLGWALARIARRLDDRDALDTARATLRPLSDRWQASRAPGRHHVRHSSWCKGEAGALLGLVDGLLDVGVPQSEVRDLAWDLAGRLATSLLGRGRDLSPCHGVAGGVQVLTHVGRRLGELGIEALARDIFDRRMARVRTEGYTGGFHRSQGHLGYMTGLTGVAHTHRILLDPAAGIPLALTNTVPSVERTTS